MRFLQFSAFKQKSFEKKCKSEKCSQHFESGLWNKDKKKLSEIGQKSREQIEF
jgi:hypothetical protein